MFCVCGGKVQNLYGGRDQDSIRSSREMMSPGNFYPR